MPREKDDNVYLWDMLEAARGVVEFTRGRTFDDFLADRLLRRAVEREIEIIGEAARRVSRPFRMKHPEIPWTVIVAQRHLLAHEYSGIKNDLIWNVVEVHIPELIAQLEPLIPPPPPESEG